MKSVTEDHKTCTNLNQNPTHLPSMNKYSKKIARNKLKLSQLREH